MVIEDNIGLAKSITRKFVQGRVEDTDEYAAALIGLWQATKGYDANQGAFSTYAARCIKNEILKERQHFTDVSLEDVEPPAVEKAESVRELLETKSNDTPRQRRGKIILKMYYFRGMNWRQIAAHLKISPPAAHKIAMQTLEKIRKNIEK